MNYLYKINQIKRQRQMLIKTNFIIFYKNISGKKKKIFIYLFLLISPKFIHSLTNSCQPHPQNMTERQQQYEPIFTLENQHILNGWDQVNPNKNNSQVPIHKVQLLFKYVFENSKDQLQMQLDPDTDYMQMITGFLQQHKMTDKKTFNLEQALNMINWAVDPHDQYQEEEEHPQNQQNQQSEAQNQSLKAQPYLQQAQNDLHKNKEVKQSKQDPQEQYKKHIQKAHSKNQYQNQKNPQPQHRSIQQQEHHGNLYQKIYHQKGYPDDIHYKDNQDEHDWGISDNSQQQINRRLYNEIKSLNQKMSHHKQKYNSEILQKSLQFSETQQQPLQQNLKQNFIPLYQQISYRKQPLSIKKSLAKLNQTLKHKSDPNQIPPVLKLKLDPTAPQMKYLKRQKIVLKNKKPKHQYHPEHIGLQQLFKFYCSLNSEFYSMSKHKDPANGTFDQFENRNTNLYMHNFMLLCKDFGISQNKMPSKNFIKKTQKIVDQIKQKKQETQAKDLKGDHTLKRKSSKGLVPESIGSSVQTNYNRVKDEINKKEKAQTQNTKQKTQMKEVWDRDKISNFFKKEADYTLNVKFDKFVRIMKVLLKDKLVLQVEKEPKQITEKQVSQKCEESKQGQNQKEQLHESAQKVEEQKQQPTKEQQKIAFSQVDRQILAICRFFQLDTKQNYQKTFSRLRTLYKIASSASLPAPRKQKVIKSTISQQNGHMKEDIGQMLKARQLQKEQRRILIKEKYLNKFSAPQINVYSSFKNATSQSNSFNSLYGSDPKLINIKSGKSTTVSQGTFGVNKAEHDMKKKKSGEFNINITNIIKDARAQIKQNNKENRPNLRLKYHSNTENQAKSRLNSVNSSQNFPPPVLGYKKLHDLKSPKEQEETLSSILLNKSRLVEGCPTNRSQKIKNISKDIHSPLLQRMGCHEDDDLLNKYFDQEKNLDKQNVKLTPYFR